MILNLAEGGVGSVNPLAVARTLKVCLPRLSFLVVKGLEQSVKGALSSLHSNVAGLTEEVNLKVGVRSVVLAFGFFVIVVLAQGVSVGAKALLCGAGTTFAQSPGAFVSSPLSSRVGHPGEMLRRSAKVSGMPVGSTLVPPVGEGSEPLKLPQATQSALPLCVGM